MCSKANWYPPNALISRNSFSIKAIVGIPHGTSKLPAFSVYPIPYPAAQMHKLVVGCDVPGYCHYVGRHPIHLALEWQKELKSDPSLTRAETAANRGLSRARVTQVMGLLKLDKSIQQYLLGLSDPAEIKHFSERKLREIATCKSAKRQIAMFMDLATSR